ncbi:MAG: type VI secretion system contractile sheath small subunit [Gemmatimonadales bacterium]|nr:type VI secretion system contractile sheath small subunit [Gemmatimonadales bacterium]
MAESTQHTLDRVRPPRVQITYDVEIGDAIQKKELPFVMGVISDLAGKPAEAPAPMKERKFVQVDRDNFNDVMKSVGPRLAFQVDNQLTDEDSKFNVELNFESMEDFDPVSVVQQVEPLRKLFEARQRLSDLRAKLDANDDLDRLLIEIVENTDGLKEIQEATAPAEDDAE